MLGHHIGTVVGNTSPHEFRFVVRSRAAKMGDLVAVQMDVPAGPTSKAEKMIVWARIIEFDRYNPFLPVEAGQELADEGIKLLTRYCRFREIKRRRRSWFSGVRRKGTTKVSFL
jgi:hypothetical protein